MDTEFVKRPDVKMKIGIMTTVAKSIYASTDLKIREAVANSMDNKADSFIMCYDAPSSKLSLFDNGIGINEVRFDQIFQSLGYGLYRKDKEFYKYYSYFGLGLLSILQLGSKVIIFSKPKENKSLYKISIQSAEIFKEENSDKYIEDLRAFITLERTTPKELAASSPLKRETIESCIKKKNNSFTEIIIEGVNSDDKQNIESPSFSVQLSQNLPLKPDEKAPFLGQIKDNRARKWIEEQLKKHAFCPTIDFFFGTSSQKNPTQLWKYFPNINREITFEKTDITYGESPSKKFFYYVVYATEDLQGASENNEFQERETGLWVRNRNFLVKSADFLDSPGRKRIITAPLRNWLYGEIYHKNMNEFLEVTRKQYDRSSSKFTEFRDEIAGLIGPLNSDLRKAWEIGDKIENELTKPFEEILSDNGPFESLKRRIAKVADVPEDSQEIISALRTLEMIRSQELENSPKISDLISKNKKAIVLADSEDRIVTIDPQVVNRRTVRKWDKDNKRLDLRISPRLFETQEFPFLGKTFSLEFVAGFDINSAVSFNFEKNVITVNPFYPDMKNYSVSFLEFFITVQYAWAKTNTKDEMRDYLLNLLGKSISNLPEYMDAMALGLSRRKRKVGW